MSPKVTTVLGFATTTPPIPVTVDAFETRRPETSPKLTTVLLFATTTPPITFLRLKVPAWKAAGHPQGRGALPPEQQPGGLQALYGKDAPEQPVMLAAFELQLSQGLRIAAERSAQNNEALRFWKERPTRDPLPRQRRPLPRSEHPQCALPISSSIFPNA